MTDNTPKQLPTQGEVQYGHTRDGDIIPVSVTYPRETGGYAKVAFKKTADGDYIPETGYTPDGDFNYPGQRWDL
jgi:hypothetical protein